MYILFFLRKCIKIRLDLILLTEIKSTRFYPINK